MQFSSIITLLFSICAIANAYTCASWVPPEDCLKSAAAFTMRMKTATFSMPKPVATGVVEGAAAEALPPLAPPKHRNCGTLGVMDGAPCDRMYRPQAAQPSPAPHAEADTPAPTNFATVVKRAATPSQA